MKKLILTSTGVDSYESDYGSTLSREYGKTPNGNDMNGRWVFRSDKGELIDFDKYRNDLAERHNLTLHSEHF